MYRHHRRNSSALLQYSNICSILTFLISFKVYLFFPSVKIIVLDKHFFLQLFPTYFLSLLPTAKDSTLLSLLFWGPKGVANILVAFALSILVSCPVQEIG